MNSVITTYKKCSCGNKEMTSEYDYKTEQLRDFCDVCGYFKAVELKNKIESGEYPEDWKPVYDTQEGKTGFVLKMFPFNEERHFTAPINKEDVKQIINELKKDSSIRKFAISFKDNLGNYQTQLYYNKIDKSESKLEFKEPEVRKTNELGEQPKPESNCDIKIDFLNNEIKSSKIDTNLISDGYHTFGELYQHRIELFIALCRELVKNPEYQSGQKSEIWRSTKHSDGSIWDNWFIMGIGKENGEQITYHLPMEYWKKTSFAQTLELAPTFDGHTSDDVLLRISKI